MGGTDHKDLLQWVSRHFMGKHTRRTLCHGNNSSKGSKPNQFHVTYSFPRAWGVMAETTIAATTNSFYKIVVIAPAMCKRG